MCLVEGCLTPVFAKGLCGKHYQRQRTYGSTDFVRSRGRKSLGSQSLQDIWRYDPETGLFHSKIDVWGPHGNISVGDVLGVKRNRGYVQLSHRGNKYLAHRVAWFFMTGKWPPADTTKWQVEHINGDEFDNRWSNLDLVTPTKNAQNLRDGLQKRNKSGYRGVSRASVTSGKKRPWRADIRVNNKPILLGYFYTLEEAVAARKAAEKQYFPADRHPE